MTWVDYFRTAIALLIVVGLLAGVLCLGHVITSEPSRVPAKQVTPSRALQVRAPTPKPELPEPAALHAAVLFTLSPELRGEFANSPNYHPNKYEPEGSYNMTTLQGVVSIDELRTALGGAVSEQPQLRG